MCSAITHAVLGVAIARVGTGVKMPARFWAATAILGAAPDVDGLAYSLGLDWWASGLWGHRGITHAIATAALVGGFVAWGLFPRPGAACPIPRWRVWLILAAAMASHGLTDMLTNGGAGVALFAPVSVHRYKWAFQPVEVSPMSVGRFFGERGIKILWNELRWVMLPAGVAVAAAEVARRLVARHHA